MRALRVIEVLERIGTRQARQTLAGLGGKDIDPALREEIRASLRRLDRRGTALKPDRDETLHALIENRFRRAIPNRVDAD